MHNTVIEAILINWVMWREYKNNCHMILKQNSQHVCFKCLIISIFKGSKLILLTTDISDASVYTRGAQYVDRMTLKKIGPPPCHFLYSATL